MAGGGSSKKSPRGPLPKFGGPPSKTFFTCQICERDVRRDKIKEHYGAYVDLDALNEPAKTRSIALARLSSDKRKHTEKIREFFDRHGHLPVDFNISEFWIKSGSTNSNPSHTSQYFNLKRKIPVIDEPPEKQMKESEEPKTVDDDKSEEPEGIGEDKSEDTEAAGPSSEKTLGSDEELELVKESTEQTTDDPQLFGIDDSQASYIANSRIKEAIMDALKDPEAAEVLAEHVAMKIRKIKEDDSSSKPDESVWKRGEDFVSCIPCLKYSDSGKVPPGLRKSRKGNYGRINLNQEQFNVTHSQKQHESNDLHKWCVIKGKILDEEEMREDSKNNKAAENTVRNVVFALKNGGGSELFVGLMDKDNLTEGIEAPTKNDSKKTFFDLREIISEEVGKRIKCMFSKVKYLTVTIDKVTVGHVSYMVILSYFFHQGRIHICLNKLEKMQECDYDGPGTAAMLVRVLMDTTGWSKPRLANRLVHMTYDGVFAELEERVRGGGSLSLRTHMCSELRLERGSITGDWDAAHNMQLTWADLLKKHPEIMKVTDCYFNVMKVHKLGKVGTHFMNRAKELGYLILTNKQHQTTRFVRALLRGLTAALRNLPTLEIVLNEEIREMELAGKNDKVNALNKNKRLMKDAKHVLFVIGLMQILEIYAEVSLSAQHANFFPTEVWSVITAAKEKLRKLTTKWEWEDKFLKLGQCGNPSILVNEIMTRQTYTPHVSDNVIRKNQSFLKTFHGVDPYMDIGRYGPENLFDEEDQIVIDLAGEMEVERVTEEMKKSVEKNLVKICKDLLNAWDERQTETGLQKASIRAFGSSLVPEEGKLEEFYRNSENLLQDVVEKIPGTHGEKYQPSEMVDGFVAWNKNLNDSDKSIPMNKSWREWISKLTKED